MITIPDGVTSIGSEAFIRCLSLTSIILPSSITSIGLGAFYRLSLNVYISDLVSWCNITFGNESHPFAYGGDLYLNGELITDLIIPKGVTSISKYCFYYWRNLTSVTIPSSIIMIDSQAFQGCTSLKTVYNNSKSIVIVRGDIENGQVGAYAEIVCNVNVELDS